MHMSRANDWEIEDWETAARRNRNRKENPSASKD
jgi:hypothetical protein